MPVASLLEMVVALIEVAKKNADGFEVSLDYLASNSKKASYDKQTMKLINNIQDLEPTVKDKPIFLANAVVRDRKTKNLSHNNPGSLLRCIILFVSVTVSPLHMQK